MFPNNFNSGGGRFGGSFGISIPIGGGTPSFAFNIGNPNPNALRFHRPMNRDFGNPVGNFGLPKVVPVPPELRNMQSKMSVPSTDEQEMRARANKWVELKVGYSQEGRQDGFRKDCSGFASWITGVPTNANGGPNTEGLYKLTTPVNKGDLKFGDIILRTPQNNDGHCVTFDKWDNNEKIHYWGYEECPGKGAVYRKIRYPYFESHDDGRFEPRRLEQPAIQE